MVRRIQKLVRLVISTIQTTALHYYQTFSIQTSHEKAKD